MRYSNPRNRHNHPHSTDERYFCKPDPHPFKTRAEREQEKADLGIFRTLHSLLSRSKGRARD